jgi:penicillin-binding protein 1A
VTARQRWVRVLRILAGLLGVAFVATLAVGLYLLDLSRSLPDLESAPGALNAARTSIVYAADESVLTEWHGEQDRKVVLLEAVPKAMRDAVLAAEDPRFYEHDGVDTQAILGALRGDTGGGAGSTLTLQLVRLLFAEGRSSGVTQKIRQALMAYELEAKTSKDTVLESYLNMVYFGNGRYGVESAARGYFGKPAGGLTLAESALLAGVIRSPSRFSPVSDPSIARVRRDAVLERMRDLGMISSEQEVVARKTPVTLKSPGDAATVAPYFVEHVKQQLIDRLGARAVFTGGLRVYTTLDPRLQRQAEEAVAAILPQPGDPEVAVASIDPRDGRILALVGGRDFATAQYNLATQARRQPGSAFKPFVLVAALERGVSPDRGFDTSAYTVKVKDGYWRVENYENGFTTGQLTLRAATDWSVNAVFARLIMEIGPESVVDAARRMGITSPLEPNPAIALGGLSKGVSPLEMASAYGTLATGGLRVEPVAVLKVTDDHGKVLFAAKQVPKRVVKQEVAALASGMLHDVVERGTGMGARFGPWVAGKTGTTQSYRDAWFVGYTADLSTAVWVGYRKAQVDMLDVHGIKVTGGSFPASIWARYMAGATSAAPAQPAQGSVPGGVPDQATLKVRICRQSFLLANPRCKDVYAVELESSLVPRETCGLH